MPSTVPHQHHRSQHPRRRALALVGGLLVSAAVPAADLATVVAGPRSLAATSAFDGVVEAVRQTVVAAQVPGAVVQLAVQAGDRVSAGQLLLRLDARAADQSAAASDAQVQAARAALEVAASDVERQRQLFQKNYISAAALDRAESQFKTTQAQVHAQQAQAAAARTQSGFYLVRAPFAGIVAEVPVSLGDMAMPGRALLSLYDPTALRISAAVPQSVSAALPAGTLARIEFPGLPTAQRWVQPSGLQTLPTLDPTTHTVQLRADLPPGLSHLAPGLYARLWLPVASAEPAALTVPRTAVLRRAELTALYVVDASGQPLLRQVRLGRVQGDRVEVLAGLSAGETVASDPQAAARAPAPGR